MSTTDPLRDALTAKLAEMELHDDLPDSFDQGYMAAWREFREALAAVPVEPNMTCPGDGEAKSSAEKLGAVPVEPEGNDERLAFLAGEGMLTVAQVQEWAVELPYPSNPRHGSGGCCSTTTRTLSTTRRTRGVRLSGAASWTSARARCPSSSTAVPAQPPARGSA